ncbi:MAG TPA: bluetail domain-containing putative surface protein [Paraburkholderia sp.]|nr:bluetail domain-containing putative surface protein [Paraburkholderia sp.]
MISNNQEITVSVTQLGTDATVIGEITNQDSSAVHVIVADTAGDITAQIGALNGNALVNKIIVTDSATHEITITAAQVGADTTVLSELFQANGTTPASVAVLDTAAHIGGSTFDTLSSNSHVNKIIVSDSSTNEVTITAAQAASDTNALNELFQADGTTAAQVAVSDLAANIASAFNALNSSSHVNKIIVSDSATNEVTITVAQAAADTAALNEMFASDGTTPAHVAVSDTAASISGAIDALNANTHVDKIIVSDSATHEVTITAAQAASDGTVLGELVQANGTTAAHVAVSDTASAISGAFDALNANSHVDKIIVSDSATHEVTISVAQAANDTVALSELVVNDGVTPAHVAVADTATAISGAFDALNANSHVNTIIVSDGSGEVTITAAQAASDTTALNELVISNGEGAHVAVSDTASNISLAFDALNANTHVNKILVDNGPGHAPASIEVAISVAQLASDTIALAELFQADGVTQAHVRISDTAANISAAFDTLNDNTQVDRISVSDSNPLVLTATQVVNDTTALSEIVSSYTIAVSDTAADITANLDALQANTHVTAIVVSDNAEITVSVAQLTSDATVISELSNADTSTVHVIVSDTAADISAAFDALNGNGVVNKIVVSDSATHEVAITVAQVNSDFAALGELVAANGISEVSVAVSDSAAHITSALDSLTGNTRVDKIIVSDSATNEVTVSVAQLSRDTTALSELVKADGTTPATVQVSDTAANISAAFNALNGNGQVNKIVVSDSATHEVTLNITQALGDTTALAELFQANGTTPAHVAVSDTALNISLNLNALNSDTQVDHIIIADNGTITLTVAQASGDSTAIGELQNQNGGPVSLTVQDTAAAISAALDALNGETNISSIVISDNAALTLNATQITSDATALAKLSDLDSSGVTINVVDTAAHISANLEALQANNDIVSITVSDSAPITVTVAQITSDAVVLSELQNADNSPVLLTVDDTAANIRANLASLNQNADITSIVISNNAVLLLSVAQLSADAHALSIMHNANGNPYALRISDTAAHISSALDTLNANTHVATIVVTDSAAIVLTVGQITSDAHALGNLANSNSTAYTLSVHDTASSISGAFDALNSNSHVKQIVVSDSATHEVLISAGQFASDITALSELFQADGTTQAHVNVADTAASVTTALNSLVSTQADKITVTDSATNEVLVSVAQITSDAAALVKLFNANGTTPANIAVSDTASDITAVLNSLNGNTQVNKIVVSDSATNEVTVSIAQITSDAHALSELYVADGSVHAKVVVSDTAANITTALDSLSANPSLVNKIVVSDSGSNEVTVNVAQLTSDATALGELFNSNGTTHANVVVNDTASLISLDFNALSGDTQVNKIIVSDSATNEVTLTASQIASDAHALSELFQANGTTLANVKVVDTAAAISSNFDALNADVSQLNKIVVTDSGSNEVTITAAQAHNDTAALNELFASDGTTPAHVAVSDTAANISVALGQLNTNTHVDHIIISDGNPLTLTTSQVIHDTTALGEIVGPYTIVVSDTGGHISANLDALEANASVTQVIVSDNHDIVVSIAQLTTDANVLSVTVDVDGLSPAALRIIDTAANIQSNLGNLEADGFNHNIDQIVVSDNGPITLSASQLNIDTDALFALRNANGTKVSLTLSDTGGHIQAVLDELQEFNNVSILSQFTSIIVTNNGQLTITAAQVHNDAQILSEIQNRNGSPVTFKVIDTAANITTYLNDLQANSHLSAIVISDNAAISLSIAQLTNDAAAIALLHNLNMTAYTLAVTDTAAHIQAVLASLNSNSHVDKIVVSDSGTHEINVTASQLTHDTTALGELYNADGVTHASMELVDAAGHIQALTATQFQAMAAEGVTQIDSTNNKLLLQVAQYEGLGTVALTQADVVTLSDTGAAISSMTAAQLGALSTNGVDKLIVTDHALTLGVDQWNALSVAVDAATTVTINGTSGNDSLTTNAGTFVVNGGGGADTFTLGAGHSDQFVYNAASDSTGTNFDTIHNFNTQVDSFSFNFAVTGVDVAVHTGALDSGANFDAELAADIGAGQLGSHHAVLFTATSGSLAGHTFLIVDANGTAGYQAGQDYVIDVTGGQHLGTLSTADFFTH